MSLDIYFRNSGISPENLPYAAALSSSASSSTSSVFSDAASQASSTSSTSCPSNWESDEWSSSTGHIATATAVNFSNVAALQPINRVSTFPQYQASACRETVQERLPSLRQAELIAPAEHRQHPRRSSTTINQRAPPQLVRQSDRKVNFVDCLVDSATQMVEVIWQLSEPKSRCETVAGRGVLPLRTFIQETLRRSRTSYSTLQVALYYLILIKSYLPKHDFTMQQQSEEASVRALQCGRRMFLAALILASKYLQDRNYSARAWSKISGLKVCEINTNEMAFLQAVNWKLHITDPVWEKWQEVVLRHTPTNPPSSPGANLPNTWKDVIPILTPELEVITVKPKTATAPVRPSFRSALSHRATRSPTSAGYGSQESTPTPVLYQAPRFLEPKPDLLPPTPMRLGPLPTPSLTPQSIASSTPAASAMAMGSRRPSMCTAMQQAQCSSLARTCVDQFNPSIRNGLEAYHFSSRRPSLVPSVSSISSSPESMMTDNSRSSRASSISSVSSVGWAPPSQASLARLATCRNAKLPYPVLSKCNEYAPSEPTSSPESVDRYQIDDAEATPMRVDSPLSVKSISPSRKRGRSSVDLQHSVRHLLNNSRPSFTLHSQPTVLPDRSIAQPSFSTLESELKGLQPPKNFAPECSRLPVQKDFGKKRTCCSTEAAHAYHRQGPGMWDKVLL
ncbi:PHO85 cyclin-5 [Ascochyta rabiei]|uniref:Regulation of cyclin-dependent protein serine/threonine kinase n=1 Tax=Didymella rabiei TaxID=5454 RepID=A0A162W3X7_DIDRA|nr:PHO85 cyclin-5 [Ascochyta rabiei]KZM18779.1 regulation of cyclin-dependent protein serine/threonine kinase [Ascochyta rabiei]UPX16026.1 PHO85 cyclin-5 [Ascochyta rabiei]